jgi:hypothetical protein
MELVYSGTWIHVDPHFRYAKGRFLLTSQGMAKPRGTGEKAGGRKRAAQPAKKVGRPRAKHSDPDYKQMSVYVHKDVRNKVKARLLEQDGEFSTLVESLLRDWLKKR